MKTDAHAVSRDENDIVARIAFARAAARELHVNQRVAWLDADGDDAALADVGKFIERCFFHCALLRRKK